MLDIIQARKSFPFLSQNCFLNFAATALVPTSTAEKMQEACVGMTSPLGKHFYQTLNEVEFVRKKLALWIDCHPSEIAFTQNTSSSISTIALAMNLQTGDKVLVPDNEFPSNFYPWKNLEKKGIICETFKLSPEKSLVEILLAHQKEKKDFLKGVKAISVSSVSYETGRFLDLTGFADFCRQQKIFTCVDAIQEIGHSHFSCRDLGVDFVASGSQKWLLGPVGCGFFFARKEILENLFVPLVGWTSSLYPEYFDTSQITFSTELNRFEPGLPNYIPLLGLGNSLDFLTAQNKEKIFQQNAENGKYLRENLKNFNVDFLVSDADSSCSIQCFRFPRGVDHRLIAEHYHKKNITLTVREDYVRVSPHFLSERKELDLFLSTTSDLFKKQIKQGASTSKIDFSASESLARSSVLTSDSQPILINGATGNLGKQISKNLLQRGYKLFLLGRNPEKMQENLKDFSQFSSQIIGHTSLDFCDHNWEDTLTKQIQGLTFSGLVNTSGDLLIDLFENQSSEQIQNLFQSQVFGPMMISQIYLTHKASKDNLGILNVVSSSGRVGYPLLSSYAAAHASLWTFSESLEREIGTEIPVKVFVAPSQHSPLQKQMGRPSLRYYQVGSAGFDYALTEDVAEDATEHFLNGNGTLVDPSLKIKLWVNSFFPEFFTKQVRKSWRLK